MRKSTVTIQTDSAGPYEVEVFEADQPKSIIVCSHGNGVRRWDGEHFFHHVADHYPDHTFLLVDQNQIFGDGCRLNPLPIMVARVQGLATMAKDKYPGVPIVLVGHSLGCGVVSRMDLSGVEKVIFVAPAAGNIIDTMKKRYGDDIVQGKTVTTTDGLIKDIPKEYVDSVKDITWEDEYRKLLASYKPVHVFESGAEEIVADDRFAHRDMPFASYKIIPGAVHNYAGKDLENLFAELDPLLPS